VFYVDECRTIQRRGGAGGSDLRSVRRRWTGWTVVPLLNAVADVIKSFHNLYLTNQTIVFYIFHYTESVQLQRTVLI